MSANANESRRPEPAERLLTMEPTRTYTLERDGIVAALYAPDSAVGVASEAAPAPNDTVFAGKALIVVGGSDGLFSLTKLGAEQFARRGIAALALAYWNQPGLPQGIDRIPVEYVRDAARALRAEGYGRVGIWGISKGAELALVAASYLSDDLGCVVAASPINVCCEGIARDAAMRGRRGLLGHSSWSFEGRELPYARVSMHYGRILRESFRARGVCMTSCYEDAVEHPAPETVIPVERIGGPVLLLSSRVDGMWPATRAAELIMERLDEWGFAHEHAHLAYDTASHFLLPYLPALDSARMFAVERRDPAGCEASRADALEHTLDFLARW